jgi:sulfur-carrier protein
MIRVLYFARLREQLGRDGETLEGAAAPPDLAALMAQFQARGGVWAEAFGGGQGLMMAVNQEMADPATAIGDGDEVAFFPPVTGG